MDFDDDLSTDEPEVGSDELLSDDQLRLPDSASMLVRLHAVRSWLGRREREVNIEIGMAALTLQEMQSVQMMAQGERRLRRREVEEMAQRVQKAQENFEEARLRLDTYNEAQALLEECVAHTTSSERVLVEFYLTLDNLIQEEAATDPDTPRLQALTDVLRRVEHVATPTELS